jgi:hypothetical protein
MASSNYGFIEREEGARRMLRLKPSSATLPFSPRMVVGLPASDIGSPDLAPLGVSWPASMGPGMMVQSDGRTATLRSRSGGFNRFGGGLFTGMKRGTTGPTPFDECAVYVLNSLDVDPVANPYNINDDLIFTANVTTTTPWLLTYEWKKDVNGTQTIVGTSATLNYTVADADIYAKDVGGLGLITFKITVYSNCDLIGQSLTENYPAQGL